jgi:hypothetical protein
MEISMKHFVTLFFALALPLAAAEPEFAVGVDSPRGAAADQGTVGNATFARIGLAFARHQVNQVVTVWVRPRVEGTWGSTAYAINGQQVRADQKTWIGGVDLCCTIPVVLGMWKMNLTAYVGAGYAQHGTSYAGVAPGTTRAGRGAYEGGLEALPIQVDLAKAGLGIRYRRIAGDAQALAYDSMSLYATVRF